ncbi:MAG: FHA domain-containing protein, partial [Variovorax sp.]
RLVRGRARDLLDQLGQPARDAVDLRQRRAGVVRQPRAFDHALPDIARTLSRSHALLEWADGLLWVTDLHTTNGTTITAPDGAVQPLVPGQRTAAAIGWHVELGERDYTVTAGDPA